MNNDDSVLTVQQKLIKRPSQSLWGTGEYCHFFSGEQEFKSKNEGNRGPNVKLGRRKHRK